MSKAYAYERFSSPEQAAGDSARRQKSAADLWCERTGVELDREFVFQDHGRSGFRGQQFSEGALGRFVEMVRAGRISRGSYLLIENLDRFSRENPVTATGRLFDLVSLGITVVTVSDGLEYSTDSLTNDIGRLMMLVLQLSQSHIESAKKSERVGKAWAEKKARARRGEHKVSARCPEWLKLESGVFVEKEEGRFAIVRGIFDQTIAGLGRNIIARRLNEKGVPPFKAYQKRKEGRPPPQGWHASAVAKILHNRAVIGEYQPGKGSHKSRDYQPDGDPIPDYYPRIVPNEIFWRAHAAMKARRQESAGRRGNRGAHVLRGLCRCASCDGPMHVVNKGEPPKGGVYLMCSSARRSAGCEMARRWRVDRLEPAVLRAFDFVVPAALSEVDGGVPKAVAAVQAIEAELTAADALRKRLLETVKRTSGADAIDAFEAQVTTVNALKADLKKAKADAAILMADPSLVSRLADAVSLSRRLEETDGDERLDLRIRINEVLKGLVDRVRFDGSLGAILELKPALSLEPRDEVVSYAFRAQSRDGHLFVSVLVEDEVTDAQVDAFLGFR